MILIAFTITRSRKMSITNLKQIKLIFSLEIAAFATIKDSQSRK